MATSLPRTKSAMFFKSSSVVTPPVGLCGELSMIAFGDGSVFKKCSMSDIAGRNSLLCRNDAKTDRASRRWMFGMYVGKYGLKTKQPSPGFKNASQKNCSKTFAPGPTTMFDA